MTNTVRQFTTGSGSQGSYYSLPALKESGVAPNLERLPTSIRIVLESVLRNCDGKKVTEQDVKNLAGWKPCVTAAGTAALRPLPEMTFGNCSNPL